MSDDIKPGDYLYGARLTGDNVLVVERVEVKRVTPNRIYLDSRGIAALGYRVMLERSEAYARTPAEATEAYLSILRNRVESLRAALAREQALLAQLEGA